MYSDGSCVYLYTQAGTMHGHTLEIVNAMRYQLCITAATCPRSTKFEFTDSQAKAMTTRRPIK